MESGHVIRLAGPWQCQLVNSSHSVRLPGGLSAEILLAECTTRISWHRRFHSPTRIELLQQVWLELDQSWGEPEALLLDGAELLQRMGRRWRVPLDILREAPSHELIICLPAEQVQAETELTAPKLILQERSNESPPAAE